MIAGKDYVVYAVDPVEAHRASARRDHRPATQAHSSTPCSGSSQETSPSRTRLHEASAFMVGKGYLSQALAQEGDGLSTMHGRVRSEYDDFEEEEEVITAEDEEDEEFWMSRILEVSMRLKESAVLKINGASMDARQVATSSSASESSAVDRHNQAKSVPHPGLERSKGTSNATGRGIDSSAAVANPSVIDPHDRKKATKAGPQRQLLHLLQALQAHTQVGIDGAPSPLGPTGQANDDAAAFKQAHFEAASSPGRIGESESRSRKAKTRFSSPARESHSSGSVHPSGAQSSPVMRADKGLATSSSSVPSDTKRRMSISATSNAQSPILGGLTPGYEVDYLSGPSPAYSAASSAAAPPVRDAAMCKSRQRENVRVRTILTATEADRQKKLSERCYNCGVRGESVWRYLNLPEGTEIRYFDASACVFGGSKQHRACNACGLYYLKYQGVSRPEHCIREANSKREEKLKKALAEAEGAASEEETGTATLKRPELDRVGKRSSFSRTLSEACAIDSKRLATTSKDGQAGKAGARSESTNKRQKKQGGSKLSTRIEEKSGRRVKGNVRQRGANVESSADESVEHSDEDGSQRNRERSNWRSPPRCVSNFEQARMRDFVLDSKGKWRSKRSVIENPTGRSVGRPPGIKTGEGNGRQRFQLRKRGKIEDGASVKTTKANEAASDAQGGLAGDRDDKFDTKANQQDDATKNLLDDGAIADALMAILSSSSPVRPTSNGMNPPNHGVAMPITHNMVHSTPGRPLGQPTKTPLGISQARYGAPAHLLNSSPATAFQTVMDEADTDWKALFGIHNGQPRRSPRKKPVGVHGQVNPYATSIVSPSKKQDHQNVDTSALLQMTSSSPLTRGRLKSGQFDWAWTSSDSTGARKKLSSAITSPASPSPHRARTGKRKAEGEMMLEAGPVHSDRAEMSTELGRPGKQARTKQHTAILDAGPFMGLSDVDVPHIEDDEDDDGPGSPTLGRSRRLDKKKFENRNSASSNAGSVPNSTAPSESGPGTALNLQQEWTRTSTMRDLFPTPSPDKRWNIVGSPSQGLWNSPTSWALRLPTPSPIKSGAKSSVNEAESFPLAISEPAKQLRSAVTSKGPSPRPDVSDPNQQRRRKPLPATVEDASPSDVSNASPTGDEEEDGDGEEEEGMVIDMANGTNMAELMSMFEDPYGLLAASGITLPAQSDKKNGQSDSHIVGGDLQNGSQDGMPFPNHSLSHIELFKSFDYAQQLGFFNEAGASGLAANAGPSAPRMLAGSKGGQGSPTKSGSKPVRTSPRRAAAQQAGSMKSGTGTNAISTAGQNDDAAGKQVNEINFGDWIWYDVHRTPVKRSPSKTNNQTTTSTQQQ